MHIVLVLLYHVVFLFFIVLIIRLVFDWIQVFSRDWKPRGIVLVLAESTYSVTDPPLRALRSLLPPLRLGAVQIDLAFLVLALACSMLLAILPSR